MVNVTHNSNYRRTRQTLFFRVIHLGNLGRILFRSLLAYFHTEVVANELCCVKINILVNGYHHAQHKESLNNLIYLALNKLSKLLHIDGFANLYRCGTNNLNRRSSSLRRIGRLTVAVYRHLMAGTAVRTAFLSSIGALNLRLFLAIPAGVTAFLATRNLHSSLAALHTLATAFATILAATSRTSSVHAAALAMHCLTGLLPLRSYENTTLTLVVIAVALTVIAITLLTIITLTVLALAAIVAITLLALATVLALAAVITIPLLTLIIALTVFRTALLAIVALILIILLHIPLPIFIIILLFRLFLLHGLPLTRLLLLFLRLGSGLRRLRLFIICFADDSHNLFISATKILFI